MVSVVAGVAVATVGAGADDLGAESGEVAVTVVVVVVVVMVVGAVTGVVTGAATEAESRAESCAVVGAVGFSVFVSGAFAGTLFVSASPPRETGFLGILDGGAGLSSDDAMFAVPDVCRIP